MWPQWETRMFVSSSPVRWSVCEQWWNLPIMQNGTQSMCDTPTVANASRFVDICVEFYPKNFNVSDMMHVLGKNSTQRWASLPLKTVLATNSRIYGNYILWQLLMQKRIAPVSSCHFTELQPETHCMPAKLRVWRLLQLQRLMWLHAGCISWSATCNQTQLIHPQCRSLPLFAMHRRKRTKFNIVSCDADASWKASIKVTARISLDISKCSYV